jgi:hypothetical protein
VRKTIRIGGAAAAAMASLWMAGCSAIPTDLSQINAPKFDTSTWFVPNSTQFAPKQESSQPITQADLVDGNGMCTDMSPLPAAAAPAPVANPENLSSTTAPPIPATRNVALQMSECEVVRTLGRAGDIQISANERGDRLVTMTYMTPERPVYRFVGGRLASIERTAEPPPPEALKKKPAPKKRAQRPTT